MLLDNMAGIIIMGFPGCGKQTFYNNAYESLPPKAAMATVDPKDCNPNNFEEDFIRLVNEKMDNYDVVFIPFKQGVMRIMADAEIDYDLFYPDLSRRLEFLKNFVIGRRNQNDIREIDKNWILWIKTIELESSEYCHKHCLKNQGEFIGNDPMITEYINSLKNK